MASYGRAYTLVVAPIQSQLHLYLKNSCLFAREIAIQEIHPRLAGQLLRKPQDRWT